MECFFHFPNPFEAVRERSDLNGLQKIREVLAFDRADEVREEINIQAIPILKDPRILAAAVEANRRVLTPLWLELIEEGRRDGSIRTEYAKELSELLPLVNFWLLPSVFPADAEEIRHKCRFVAEVLPAGAVFLFPFGIFIRYAVIVAGFCGMQAAIGIFSIFAVSMIRQNTSDALIGKIMAYTAAVTMCAQPIGQMVYGFLFDRFHGAVYLVLIPSGIMVYVIGLLATGFFGKMEGKQGGTIN